MGNMFLLLLCKAKTTVIILRLDVALLSQREWQRLGYPAGVLVSGIGNTLGVTPSSRSVPEVILSQEQEHYGWTASGQHDSVSQGSAAARYVAHFVGVCDVDPVVPCGKHSWCQFTLPNDVRCSKGDGSVELGDAYKMVISGTKSTEHMGGALLCG